jgi:hypothetical protein
LKLVNFVGWILSPKIPDKKAVGTIIAEEKERINMDTGIISF